MQIFFHIRPNIPQCWSAPAVNNVQWYINNKKWTEKLETFTYLLNTLTSYKVSLTLLGGLPYHLDLLSRRYELKQNLVNISEAWLACHRLMISILGWLILVFVFSVSQLILKRSNIKTRQLYNFLKNVSRQEHLKQIFLV